MSLKMTYLPAEVGRFININSQRLSALMFFCNHVLSIKDHFYRAGCNILSYSPVLYNMKKENAFI